MKYVNDYYSSNDYAKLNHDELIYQSQQKSSIEVQDKLVRYNEYRASKSLCTRDLNILMSNNHQRIITTGTLIT